MNLSKLKIIILSIIILLTIESFSQGVSINTNGNPPDSSAILDLNSTSQGFLVPRMTEAQRNAISSPAEGLQIYNLDSKCFEFYALNQWFSSACATCPTPDVPAEGTHVPDIDQVEWNWDTVTNATGYKWNTVDNYGTATDNGSSNTYTQTSLDCETAYTLYVWAYNACGASSSVTLSSTTTECIAIYTYTGSDQTFTVPAGVTSIQVKLWGAGGGAGWASTGGYGGGGGYAQGDISVSGGQNLTIIVGGKGRYSSTAANYGGGGGAGFVNSMAYPAGSGGGRSAIRNISGTELITAGGGGGAGSNPCGTTTPGCGGPGGGTSGSAGQNGTGACLKQSGGGGTQVAGGAMGGTCQIPPTDGSAYQGGTGGGLNGSNCRASGGGGGGGYYGGGGAQGGECNELSTGGGGGGSSYIAGPGVSNASTAAGSTSNPGNSGDSDRSGSGVGGTGTSDGTHGIVIIRW